MRHERLALAALLLVAIAPTVASAQATSRAARVLSLLGPDAPAVLVTRDRVWTPDGTASGGLSACAGTRCAPILSSEACAVPRCPGSGALLALAAPIADLGDLPTDRDGFNRAMDALRTDPALAPIAWSFGVHPEPVPAPSGPPRWIERGRTETVVWELGAGALGGALVAAGIPITGGEVSGGFRFTWDPRNDDDEFLALLLGSSLGLDVRVRALALFPGQEATQWTTTIGLAPAFAYVDDHDVFRLPTLYSFVIPEVGVALREGRDAIWYAGWSLPFTFLLEEHLGVEARASVLVMDDWVPGDDVEVVTTLGVGLIAR